MDSKSNDLENSHSAETVLSTSSFPVANTRYQIISQKSSSWLLASASWRASEMRLRAARPSFSAYNFIFRPAAAHEVVTDDEAKCNHGSQ
jgi:hypothetical protein